MQIGVDVDDKKMYEVLFRVQDSAHNEESKSSMFSEESRQYQNTGFIFFQILPRHGYIRA